MIGLLRDLLGHQEWADAVFFRTWGGSEVRSDLELVTRTHHLLAVQGAFLGVLKGEEALPEAPPQVPFEGLLARCQRNHEVFGALGRGLDEVALNRIVGVPWFSEPPCQVTVADALVQVCLHSQHHRGQNLSRLKALGAAVKNVDYIIWLWKQKPAGRWPES